MLTLLLGGSLLLTVLRDIKEDFIACFKINGNVGFFIAMVDSLGYAGTVVVLFLKEVIQPQADWLQVFNAMGVAVGVFCVVVFMASMFMIAGSTKIIRIGFPVRKKKLIKL